MGTFIKLGLLLKKINCILGRHIFPFYKLRFVVVVGIGFHVLRISNGMLLSVFAISQGTGGWRVRYSNRLSRLDQRVMCVCVRVCPEYLSL